MIQTAKRENTYTLTSIAGASGSGKTYSAILYARGLVGEEGKIGFIDTENKRSRHYADVSGGFEVYDLAPPFAPARYIKAIEEFEEAGFKALVIDSISHEWEGTGGVCEMADEIEIATKKPGLHCWKRPKLEHKRLMQKILQTRMHLIFCCRAKETVRQTRENGRTVIVKDGFAPICEKSFIFEMTLSMMLEQETHIPILTKCPADLLIAFDEKKPITSKTGSLIRKWAETGETIDEERERLLNIARSAANNGTEKFREWFANCPKDEQKTIRDIVRELEGIAYAADERDRMVIQVAQVQDDGLPSVSLNEDRVESPNGSDADSPLFEGVSCL